jgi:hypothetical protein
MDKTSLPPGRASGNANVVDKGPFRGSVRMMNRITRACLVAAVLAVLPRLDAGGSDSVVTTAAVGKPAAAFAEVILPSYAVDGATLAESLELLRVSIEKHSKDKHSPNFVVQDPQGRLRDAKVTLDLKHLPARAVLQYICDQVRARYRIDEHAVVVMPR